MSLATHIRYIVEETPLVDTHEHLIEEGQRLGGEIEGGLFPCNDWAFLFAQYLGDDLCVSGMREESFKRFLSPEVGSAEKSRLIEPHWNNVKQTGYARAVRIAMRDLYGIDELTAETAPVLDESYRAFVQPGFYRDVINRRANIEHCQVNSLQRIFMESGQPDLLRQDIGFPALSTDLDLTRVEREFGRTATTLDGWLEIIDDVFNTYGSLAVAAKNQCAYGRRLNFDETSMHDAEAIFKRVAAGETMSRDERKPIEDYLFRYCVQRATEQGLPVKLHCGYYAGRNGMPLERVRQNAADLCPLLKAFPDTKFILMHVGYPYQDEYIALAKHYANAYVDMCWAWIINPAASVRFLKEFLVAAPTNKLLTFGGDYIAVENVYGHAKIARRGVAQAFTQLVEEGWIAIEEAPDLIRRVMRENANALTPPARIAV